MNLFPFFSVLGDSSFQEVRHRGFRVEFAMPFFFWLYAPCRSNATRSAVAIFFRTSRAFSSNSHSWFSLKPLILPSFEKRLNVFVK
jgi:hypothetical protein